MSIAKQVELDVSIGNRLMLQHVPALVNNSQYEDRSIYQFDFNYMDNVPDDTGLIETVIIDGSYEGGAAGGGGNVSDLTCHHVIKKYEINPLKEAVDG